VLDFMCNQGLNMTPYETFRANIDERSSKLMDELEAFARRNITIAAYDGATMGTVMGRDSATVNVPRRMIEDVAEFKRDSACHELQHIRRYWIELTPRFVDYGHSQVGLLIKNINNMVEHINMAPFEVDFGYDPIAFTNDTMETFTSGLSDGNKNAARENAVIALMYLLAKTISSPTVFINLIKVCKKKHLHDMIYLAARLRPFATTNKIRLFQMLYAELNINTLHARHNVFDIRNETVVEGRI